MSAVTFTSVSHAYTDQPVLQNINASFEKDQITVILGTSGSGKSTLLQMINGLIIPDSGSVSLFNQPLDYNRLSQLRLQIGYSIQGTSLFPHMTVQNNIALLPAINGHEKSKTEERIRYLMKFVNLDISFLQKYPHQLSGGEQQRVGICRALILNPPIFLLDEAFGALDPTTRNELHKELLALQQAEPRTIIMVTHDVYEAFKLAQNIMILNNGVIEQHGSPDDIKNQPATIFVRKFVQGVL